VPNSNLIIDSIRGRGAKTGDWQQGAHQITGIGLPPLSGEEAPDKESGAGGPRGILWSASPAKMRDEELTITGAYVHSAPGSEADQDEPEGSAGALGLDSNLSVHGKLHLHGELAYSDYDADGAGDQYDGEQAVGFGASASYVPEMAGNTRMQFEADFRELGPGFKSLANPGLRDDQRRMRLAGSLQRKGFSLQGEVSRTLDNVTESSGAPALETDALRLDAEYRPSGAGGKEDGMFIFDNPRYSVSYSNRQTEDAGDTNDARPTDTEISDLTVAMEFAPGRGKWKVEHRLYRSEDHTNAYRGRMTRGTHVNLAVPLNEQVHLASSLERETQEQGAGGTMESSSFDLKLSVKGSEGWKGSLGLSQSARQSDGGIDQSTLAANVRVDKSLPSLPGDPDVWFGGSYELKENEGAGSDGSEFGLFFGLEMELGSG